MLSRIDAMSCGPSAFLRTKRRPTPKQDRFGFLPPTGFSAANLVAEAGSGTRPRSQLAYSITVTERTERPSSALLAFTSRYISSGICIVAFMAAIIAKLPYNRNAVFLYHVRSLIFRPHGTGFSPTPPQNPKDRIRRQFVRRRAVAVDDAWASFPFCLHVDRFESDKIASNLACGRGESRNFFGRSGKDSK